VSAPAPGWLWLSIVFAALGLAVYARQRSRLAPPRPDAADRAGALRAETPAVVNMLTNDATVTAAALRATMIDLGARGWLRILAPEEEIDELARVRPAATAYQGDSLRPHERLVLQHVMSRFTTDRAIPARYLAVDVQGAWWKRFSGLVADEARTAGLVTRRWAPLDLLGPAGLLLLSALTWFAASSNGDDTVAVIDSIERRLFFGAALVAIVVLAVRVGRSVLRPEYTLTEDGIGATRRWLAVRARLDTTGFAELAPSGQDVGDRRLAYAAAMCLADGAAVELPLAREDHHRAWSSVGGRARLVRVKYPARIAYGMEPFVALGVGLVLAFVGSRIRRWSDDVARGEAFDWVYEQFPEQDWLIADVATGLTVLAFVPIVVGLWMAFAGAADGFSRVERTGIVIRARRPVEVSPLPRALRRRLDRDRYRIYLAVDDGSSDTIVAWQARERTAVPQGATAEVTASMLLGHVRRAIPIGHRLLS